MTNTWLAMDLPAGVHLQTVRAWFQEYLLPREG